MPNSAHCTHRLSLVIRYLAIALATLVALTCLGGCALLPGMALPTVAPAPTDAAPAPTAPAGETPQATLQTPPLASPETPTTSVEANAPYKVAPTVVPILYDMFDWGTDFQQQHPEWGPVGSIQFVTWEEINPAPGQYNWSVIDKELAKEAGLQVTLPDGTQIQKPVVIQVFAYLSSATGWSASDFYDATPQWVYQQVDAASPQSPRPVVGGRKVGYVIKGCDRVAVMPMYDNSIWRRAYFDMVRAFGERYNDHPQVTSVVINTGIDGETHAIKDWHCAWKDLMQQQVSGVPYYFTKFVQETMEVYREAFPTKPIFINNAPGGSSMRRVSAEYAASFNPPIGLKHSGMWIDLDSHRGYGTFVGSWDMMRTYSMTLPIWLESPYGLGDREHRYWSLIAGLHYHPDAIDLHEEYFHQSDPEWLRFTVEHLGVNIGDTPDVWTVLRDSEYPKQSWGSGGVSGHVGDWCFWLYRTEKPPQSVTERVWRDQMPAARDHVYSRQARRTRQDNNQIYMAFDIDDAYPYMAQKPVDAPEGNVHYTVWVTLLNTGTDTFALQYRNWDGSIVSQVKRKGPGLGPVDTWVTVPFVISDGYLDNNLPGGADFRLSCERDGDEYVHMVRVSGGWDTPPANDATPTPEQPYPTTTATTPAAPPPTPAKPTATRPIATPTELAGAERFAPVADTYLDQWEPASSPHRAGKLSARDGDVRVPLLQFDLSAIPANAAVEKALLRVRVFDKTNPAPLTLAAHRINRPWDAATCNWTQAAQGTLWALPGAGDVPQDRAAVAVGQVLLAEEERWYDLDVTALVREWVQNPASNYGLLLSASSAGSVQYDLYSSDHPDQTMHPHLAVVWHEPGAGTPTAPAAPEPLPTDAATRPGELIQVRLQQGASYQGVSDAFLDAWSPTANQAHAPKLAARQGSVRVPIIRFDLESIPAQASIKQATLSLYVVSRTNPGTATTNLVRVARPWSATSVTWEQATATDAWVQPGAREPGRDRSPNLYASADLQADRSWVSWDITALVQEWVANPTTNYGLMILTEGNVSVQYDLASSEWYPGEFRPRLDIEYVVALPTPTPAVTETPPATATAAPTATLLPPAGSHTFQQGAEDYRGCADAYVDGAHPQDNYGASPTLLVGQNHARSALLRFDLQSVPPSSVVQQARLSVYVTEQSGAQGVELQAYSLLKPWTDDKVTYQRASREQAWHTEGIAGAGVDLAAEPEDSVSLSDGGQWVTFDVTQLAQAWIAHPSENLGVALKLAGSGAGECALAAAEWPDDPTLRPKLELEWTTTGPAPTVGAPTIEPYPAATPTLMSGEGTAVPRPTPTPGPMRLTLQQGVNGYQGTQDTHLDSWSQTANFGPGPVLYLREGKIQVALIRYDLADLPADAVVLKATLNLWVTDSERPTDAPLKAYLMAVPWQEDAATWLEADMGRLWNGPGADSSQDYRAWPFAEARLPEGQQWVSLDITQAVQQWARRPQGNYGLLLRLEGAQDGQYQFASSEWEQVEQRPRLTVTYAVEPAASRQMRGILLLGAIGIAVVLGLVFAMRGSRLFPGR